MGRSRRPDSGEYVRFPTTQWTIVNSAGDRLNDGQLEALNEVLTQYWPAIRAHLITNRRIDPNEADDLVQSFLKDRVLESDLLAAADRDRGRFRSLLVKALENYVANETRRRQAQKRQPDRAVELDDPRDSVATNKTPPKLAEAAWARETLSLVLERTHEQCRSNGRDDVWDVFQNRIVGPILNGAEPIDYNELVRRNGFASTAQAQNVLVTAKRMFCRTMRDVLCELGTPEADVDAEIQELEQCLSAY